jgi:hypothetical protein
MCCVYGKIFKYNVNSKKIVSLGDYSFIMFSTKMLSSYMQGLDTGNESFMIFNKVVENLTIKNFVIKKTHSRSPILYQFWKPW